MGDLVATVLDGTEKPVRWLGHRHIDLSRHPRPTEVLPVRIRAGAMGEGLPHRDLLVSPGHRMMLDGGLVCAVDLVNGATVVQDVPASVEYWHVELDVHDVILAEGVPAKSYQDTGNRAGFDNGAVTVLHPVLDGEAATPCLPYAGASRALRERLALHAEVLSWRRERDPAPWLEVDGRRVDPVRRHGRYRFTLPKGYEHAVLRSRAVRPCDTSAGCDDRRRLGLLLHRLALRSPGGWREVALDNSCLDVGFHQMESADGWAVRWTDGAAVLPVGVLADGYLAMTLEVAIDEDVLFWVEPAISVGEDVLERWRA